MAKKKSGRKPGTFFRIALPDGTFGYARMLEPPYTAFYRYQTPVPEDDLASSLLPPSPLRSR